MFYLQENEKTVVIKAEQFSSLPVHHGITTRLGGVSEPPFDSLNMSFSTGDNPVSVIENRKRACRAVNMDPSTLVAGEQVHGASYHVVGQNEAGRGAFDGGEALPGVDCMVTNEPGVALISFYADCVPLMFVDPATKSIALAHAGWRGTYEQVGQIAVRALYDHYGADPADIRVVVGPSIGPCCYEVSQELAIKFHDRFGPDIALGRQLDLRLANTRSLLTAGVAKDHIHVAPWCTSCHQKLFFSHRASSGKTGRIATLLSLVK